MTCISLKKITLAVVLPLCSLTAMAAKPQYAISAGKDEVCKLAQGFLNSERSKVPAGWTLLAQPQKPASGKLPAEAQGEQLASFDFDNDGVPDQVFSHEGASN